HGRYESDSGARTGCRRTSGFFEILALLGRHESDLASELSFWFFRKLRCGGPCEALERFRHPIDRFAERNPRSTRCGGYGPFHIRHAVEERTLRRGGEIEADNGAFVWNQEGSTPGDALAASVAFAIEDCAVLPGRIGIARRNRANRRRSRPLEPE